MQKIYYLSSIKKAGIEKKLKTAIPVEIEFEDNEYIASNDDIGLLAVQSEMELLIEEIKEQLGILWQEYVPANDEELTPSGKDLQELLLSISI
ncbi:MAG: hypothetical protein PHG90_06105 [Clostridia bacterium]|nr:hypothetical protein [Clostridia bacterium]